MKIFAEFHRNCFPNAKRKEEKSKLLKPDVRGGGGWGNGS